MILVWQSGRKQHGLTRKTTVLGEALYSAARNLKEKWSGKRKFLIETSGGIEEGNLKERAVNGWWPRPAQAVRASHELFVPAFPEIDILSTSAVHQSVQHVDFSLKIQTPK